LAKKDNKGIIQKVRLRQLVLNEIQNPVVMETNAGFGHIFTECYQGIPVGVAFETDMEKCNALVMQRPSWAVYQNRCEPALESGCGFHVPVNFVDVDPYGDPWPIIDALLCNASKLPDRWGLAVNDGLKRYLMMGRGWKSASVGQWVAKVGNDHAHGQYLEIVRVMLTEKLAALGMEIKLWNIHSAGHGGQMTHYGAVIERKKAPTEAGAL